MLHISLGNVLTLEVMKLFQNEPVHLCTLLQELVHFKFSTWNFLQLEGGMSSKPGLFKFNHHFCNTAGNRSSYEVFHDSCCVVHSDVFECVGIIAVAIIVMIKNGLFFYYVIMIVNFFLIFWVNQNDEEVCKIMQSTSFVRKVRKL